MKQQLTLLAWRGGMEFSSLFLIIRLPLILIAIAKALFRRRPTRREFWAFSRMDAGFRSWYAKIANDLAVRGRMGYVPDDGLGAPLGARIYNNSIVYRMLALLGHRRLSALGWVAMLTATAILLGLTFGWAISLPAILLVAGSPVVVAAFTHLGKPEMALWPAAIPFFWLALAESGHWTGLVWSVLAASCFSIAFVTAIFAAPLLVWGSLRQESLPLLAIAVLPGVLKIAFRFRHMLRAGFAGKLATEQTRVVRLSLLPGAFELGLYCPFLLSVAFSGYTAGRSAEALLIAAGWIVPCWINWRFLYFADIQSLSITLLVGALVFAAWCVSPAGLAVALLLAWCRLKSAGLWFSPPAELPLAGKLRWWWCAYPFLCMPRLPESSAITAFFKAIPDHSRFISESTGQAMQDSRYRAFWAWSRRFLPARGIEQANYEYTRMFEPELSASRLERFRAPEMTAAEMTDTAMQLGASTVVCHTLETVDSLKVAGWRELAFLSPGDLAPLAEIVLEQPCTLWLLGCPNGSSLVEGTSNWQWEGSRLLMNVDSAGDILVRWRHVPWATANQGGEIVPLSVFRPFDGLPLAFMKLEVPRAGLVRLDLRQPFV